MKIVELGEGEEGRVDLQPLVPPGQFYFILTDINELFLLLECYADVGGVLELLPLSPENLCGKIVRILGMPTSMEDWNGTVPVQLTNLFDFSDEGEPFYLPLPALVEIQEEDLAELFKATTMMDENGGAQIDEAESEAASEEKDEGMINERPVIKVVRHKESEVLMVQILAAETIQEAYRRYRECLNSKRHVKILRSDSFVRDSAADTIKSSFITRMYERRRDTRDTGNTNKELNEEDEEVIEVIEMIEVAALEESAPVAIQAEIEENGKVEGADAETDWTAVSLPNNWEMRFDEAKDKHYYVDHAKKRTQWLHPEQEEERRRLKKEQKEQKEKEKQQKEEQQKAVNDNNRQKEMAVDGLLGIGVQQRIASHRLDSDNHNHANLAKAVPLPLPLRSRSRSEDVPIPTSHRSGGSGSNRSKAITKANQSTAGNGSLGKRGTKVKVEQERGDKFLMIDEAHAVAIAEGCSLVTLKAQEAILLLDALSCDMSKHATDVSHNVNQTVPPLELPLLHEGSLASVLTAYARSHEVSLEEF